MAETRSVVDSLLFGAWALLSIASAVDAREHRLPNQLTVPALGLALAWAGVTERPGDWFPLWLVIAGAHMLLVVLPPFALGGGDWKLVAAIAPSMIVLDYWQLWLTAGFALAAVFGLGQRLRGRRGRIALGPWMWLPWTALLMGDFAPCCVG